MNATSRRALLGSIALGAAASIIAIPAEVSTLSPDAEVLAAWRERQATLAAIEARGSFFSSETHSPTQVEIYDRAEMRIHDLPAQTIEGALAKAWVAMSHVGTVYNEDDRILHDAIRRADIDDVRVLLEGEDLDLTAAFGVIETLSAIMNGGK